MLNAAKNQLTEFIFPSDRRRTTTTSKPIRVLDEHSTTPKPNVQTNQIETTPQPVRTTTKNSFWSEWSATNPTPIKDDEVHGSNSNHVTETHADLRQTTPRMPDWMKDVVDEYSTTTKKADLLPWMQDVLNEYSTTAKSSVTHNNHAAQTTTVKSETELPSWLRDVLNEVSTTTVRSVVPAPFVTSTTKRPTFNGGSLVIGDGSDSLHVSTPNRYSM